MFICIECHKASGCARVWRRDSQRAGQWIGLDKEEVIRISGHSAAQSSVLSFDGLETIPSGGRSS
jgi:hypothetical protein